MAAPTTATMRLDRNPVLGVLDLVIDPIGGGRGRIGLDRTVATPLLIALGTDRRAEPDDTLPEMLTQPAGAPAPLFGRRGWVGDILLPQAQRYGWRGWLYSRAGATEGTRVAMADAAAQAVEPIAAYHDITIDTQAAWFDRARGILQITVSAGAIAAATRVSVL